MATPVHQLTVEEAHKEFIVLLVGEIAAISEQLDSGRFGMVDTPAFNAKFAKLSDLFSPMILLL